MKERPLMFNGSMVRAILDGTKTQTRRIVKPQPETMRDMFPTSAEDMMADGYSSKRVFKITERPGVYRCLGMQNFVEAFSPYGLPGDRLWVRESYRLVDTLDQYSVKETVDLCLAAGYPKPWAPIQYEADGARDNWMHIKTGPHDGPPQPGKLRPSIFMPRWACRILLEVTGVRAERLQEISEEDAVAEGVELDEVLSAPIEKHWRCYGYEDDRYCLDARASYRSLWDQINGTGSWELNPMVWRISFRRIN